MLDALKDTVFRGLISYSTLVFGFLPNLFFFFIFLKVPKLSILIISSFLRVLISNSIVSLKKFSMNYLNLKQNNFNKVNLLYH